MNRTLVLLATLLLLVGGAWYWWSIQSNVPATIAITAPAGGEILQSGEKHTISWKTHGVPASDKISITIRRIPPPPLQEEGQEFDPIVFTDIPNTGSTTWTISEMYPGGTFVLGISAYAAVPITNVISAESRPFTITHPKLAIDLYPLYTGATWKKSVVESFTIGTTTYSGASVTSEPIDVGMNPASVITSFESHYDKLLKEHGWLIANDLAAGGHVGGQTGYRNDSDVILTRFHINYKKQFENAPSECPCDITLSLFSTISK